MEEKCWRDRRGWLEHGMVTWSAVLAGEERILECRTEAERKVRLGYAVRSLPRILESLELRDC